MVPNARSIVSMGNFSSPVVWLGLLGILLTIILVLRKVPGALIISILLLTIAGLFLPGAALHSRITPLPHSLLSWPNSISPIFLKLDLAYSWRHPGQSIPIVLALFFSDLFSAMAVLLAIGSSMALRSVVSGLGPNTAHAADSVSDESAPQGVSMDIHEIPPPAHKSSK